MKLVSFKDGKFGVRRFSFTFMSYMYLDLINPRYWWSRDSDYFKDCRGTREQAERGLAYFGDKGTVVRKEQEGDGDA